MPEPPFAREDPPVEAEVVTFADDDAGYEAWIDRNGGYVLRSPRTNAFILHDSECRHLQRDGDVTLVLTRQPRHCSRSRQALAAWAKSQTGEAPLLCRSCM